LEHCATFRILPKRTIRIPDEVGRPRTWGLRLRHCNRMTVRRGHIGENPKIIRISSKRELTALCSCRISKFQVIYIFIRINCSYKNKKLKNKGKETHNVSKNQGCRGDGISIPIPIPYPQKILLPQNPTYPYPHPVFSLQEAYFNLQFVTLTVVMMCVLCESVCD